MKFSSYLDDNTEDNRRSDIEVVFTVNENDPARRIMHYQNRSSYEKFLHHDDYRTECRDKIVGIYNCLSGYISLLENGSKIFQNSDFPPGFESNPIHDWLKFEFEIENHYPKIGSVTITGAEDLKIMEVSCHFIDTKKPKGRFSG